MSDVGIDCVEYTVTVYRKLEEPQQKGHCPEVAERYREGDGMTK